MHVNNKGSNWKYLVCEQKSYKKIECPSRPLNYHSVELFVLNNLRSINWQVVLSGPQRVVEFDTSAALVGELAAVEEKLANLLDLAERGALNVEALAKRMEALEQKRGEIGQRIKDGKEGRTSRDLENQIAHQSSEELSSIPIQRLTPEQRLRLKTIISHLVSRIFGMRGPGDEVLLSMELNSGNSVLIRGEKATGKGIYDHTSAFRPAPLHLLPDEFIARHFGHQTVTDFAILRKSLIA